MFGVIAVLTGYIGKAHLEEARVTATRLTETEAKVRVIEALLQRMIITPAPAQ